VLRVVLLLLGLWVALIVVAWVIKGLFWLAVIGGLFFVATSIVGASRRR
jgi:hypothetical protein